VRDLTPGAAQERGMDFSPAARLGKKKKKKKKKHYQRSVGGASHNVMTPRARAHPSAPHHEHILTLAPLN